MKKKYSKPTMRVVRIQHQCHILAASGPGTEDVVSTNPSYARGFGGWDDDWDEE